MFPGGVYVHYNKDVKVLFFFVYSSNEHHLGGAPLMNYHTYCAAVTETEVDVLTGESQIRRVDIMADYGER